MRRSAGPTENDAKVELNAKENQSNDRISITATMDNGTMVEAFKYLNYCQLATNGLVSKRYRDLIRTHRNTLALLYVNNISMEYAEVYDTDGFIKLFGNELSPEEYNEWVICNQYSKQVPLEGPIAMQSAQNNIYDFCADAKFSDFQVTSVFYGQTRLNHENWSMFQHFAHLLTDPFIYISHVKLIPDFEDFNLLASSITSDHNRLQCNELTIDLQDNIRKFMSWIKDHVLCNKFEIQDFTGSNYDEELLDFFMTGAICTSEINVVYHGICKVITDFAQVEILGTCGFSSTGNSNLRSIFTPGRTMFDMVECGRTVSREEELQKFMDLKSYDQSKMVECIRGSFFGFEAFKLKYAEFIVKANDEGQVFEFVNSRVGKKLLAVSPSCVLSDFSLKIANL